MTSRTGLSSTPLIHVRKARFEDVAEVLRLIARAIERGCRRHYSARERRAVYASYARCAFLDVMAPYETLVVESESGALTAFAQLDPSTGGLRALFVDDQAQGHGVGRALLAHVVARAAAHGCPRVHGAMALNAVPFYERAGFSVSGVAQAGACPPITLMRRRMERAVGASWRSGVVFGAGARAQDPRTRSAPRRIRRVSASVTIVIGPARGDRVQSAGATLRHSFGARGARGAGDEEYGQGEGGVSKTYFAPLDSATEAAVPWHRFGARFLPL